MSSCGEAVTILGTRRPVVNELGVTVRVCHGFGSTGMEGQIGELFETIKKPITVFVRRPRSGADTISSATFTRSLDSLLPIR